MDKTPNMICDKAGQFNCCKNCIGAKPHKSGYCTPDQISSCSRATDEQYEKGIRKEVLVMCVPVKTKYLLLSHINETIGAAFAFEHEADDLDVGSPYDNNRQSGMDCGFAVGSNQSIIKLEDATPKMIELSEK